MRTGQMVLALAVLGVTSGVASAAPVQMLIKWGNTVPAVDTATNRAWNSVPINAGTNLQPSLASPMALKWADGSSGPTLAVSEPADVVWPTGSTAQQQYVGFNNNGANGSGPTPAQLTGDAAGFNWVGTTNQAYGNTGIWAGGYAPAALLTITGLDHNTPYNLYFFGARIGVSPVDIRTTDYTVTGMAAQPPAVLDATNNYSNVAKVLNVLPDASGTFTIDIRADASNTNTSSQGGDAAHFYYLNVLEIDAVPEPTSMGVLGLGALALLKRRRA